MLHWLRSSMMDRFLILSLCAALGVLLFAPGCHSAGVAPHEAIEMRFDRLDRLVPDLTIRSDVPDRDAAHIFSEAYHRQLSPFQTSGTLAKLADADVVLLFRAASMDNFTREILRTYVICNWISTNCRREVARRSGNMMTYTVH